MLQMVDARRASPGVGAWWPSDCNLRLGGLLKEVHDEQIADAAFEQLVKDGFQALREACSAALSQPEFKVAPFDWTPDVVLEAFGSTRQGTAVKSSDLDVRMTFEQFEVHRHERQMFYLKGIADSPGSRFKVFKLIPGRVPVLRMRFDDRLDVDLSMGGTFDGGDLAADTVGVDHYIKALLAAAAHEETARRFVCLVKIFARGNALIDAHLGYLSSTSWTLLAISFLQSQRCLPAASAVVADLPGKDGVERPSKRPRADGPLWPVELTPGLLSRFFAYMEHLGDHHFRVSVFSGRIIPMHNITCSGAQQIPLFLEYPSERRRETNVAMTLKTEPWQRIVGRCREARLALRPKDSGPWASREGDAVVALAQLLACAGGDDGKGIVAEAEVVGDDAKAPAE